MDLLDRLLNLGVIDGYLDVRCEMRGDWVLDNERPGLREMPFHVLLHGCARIEGQGLPSMTLGAGEVLLLPSGLPHRILDCPAVGKNGGADREASGGQPIPATSTTLLCGRIVLPHPVWRLCQALLPPSLVIHTQPERDNPAGSRLGRVLTLMREETEAPLPGSTAVLRHLAATLFALALRAAASTREPPPGILALSAHPRLRELALQILAHPGSNWTLEAMAEMANMSRSTLIRNFQAVAGTGPAEFLTRLRMAEASRLLRESDQSVAEVGEAVGYGSDAAFQRAFKRDTGFTPAAWRTMPQPETVARPVRRITVG